MRKATRSRAIPATLALLLALASLGAHLGRFHWTGDTLALLVDYYFWIALGLGVGFLWLRSWRWLAVAALLLLLNGAQLVDLAPATASAQAGSVGTGEPVQLRVLVYNIYYRNPDLQAVVDEVLRHDADVVFLMEYSEAIQQQIEDAFEDYPYRMIRPSRFTMGLALFSRFPLEESTVHRFPETRIPIFQANLRVGDEAVTFVGGHPWPPLPQWGQLHRNQLMEIAGVAARSPHPLMVAGDFNASQWSHAMHALADAAGVERIRRGPEIGLDLAKTWHLNRFIGLPLDHVLVSPEWQVIEVAHGSSGGSDHVPIIVDLQLQ